MPSPHPAYISAKNAYISIVFIKNRKLMKKVRPLYHKLLKQRLAASIEQSPAEDAAASPSKISKKSNPSKKD